MEKYNCKEVKMKKLIYVMSVLVLCCVLTSASTQKVEFIGDWEEGETLYSEDYNIEDGYFYGRDVYPLRTSTQNRREKVCEIYTKTRYKRVCTENTNGYREVKRYRCSSHGYPWSEVTCEWVTYQIPTRSKKICKRVPYEKEYKKCKWIRTNKVKIGCQNPSGYTNQLNLENFKYSKDGINWLQVPYYNKRIYLEHTLVKFKLEIPEECSPKYNFNKAIYIRD